MAFDSWLQPLEGTSGDQVQHTDLSDRQGIPGFMRAGALGASGPVPSGQALLCWDRAHRHLSARQSPPMHCQVRKEHKIETVPTSERDAHLREKSYPPCSFHRGGPCPQPGVSA